MSLEMTRQYDPLTYGPDTTWDNLPPERKPSWGQPRGDEPIIDAARISLSAYGKGRSPKRTLAMFLWLRALRPVITVGIWFCALWYVWPYVLGARSQPQVMHLLGVYALVIAAILLAMLVIAPLRRRMQRREMPPEAEQSSLQSLASFIDVPTSRLQSWQRARQLVVQHDKTGHVRDAVDTGAAPMETRRKD